MCKIMCSVNRYTFSEYCQYLLDLDGVMGHISDVVHGHWGTWAMGHTVNISIECVNINLRLAHIFFISEANS